MKNLFWVMLTLSVLEAEAGTGGSSDGIWMSLIIIIAFLILPAGAYAIEFIRHQIQQYRQRKHAEGLEAE